MDKTKLIKAGKSPIGIIVFHADHDWTRQARVTISMDNFPGMVNVGARIIAIRVDEPISERQSCCLSRVLRENRFSRSQVIS